MARPVDLLLVDSIRTYAQRLIRNLLERARIGGSADTEFNYARMTLERLPLTSAEFATAINRLANARTYLHAGEKGAALFELRLLFRSLETRISQVRK